MIPVTPLFQEAVRYSNTLSIQADIWLGSHELLIPNVPVTAGKVSYDRTSKIRSEADMSLALQDDEATQIDCERCRVRLYRGAESLGIQDRQQLGEFRIDEVDRTDNGVVSISCSGLEIYIDDARFLVPRTPPYGSSTVGTIRDLILEVLPDATVIALNTYNKPVQATSPWDKERWDAIDALAASINAEVFANYLGQFIIADIPSISSGVPVMVIDEGPGGVMIARKEKATRDQVYNAVSVSGESSDTTVPPVWAWAYDNDPASATYYYGDFGQVPRFYTSKFLVTTQQCQNTADGLLADALARNKALSFTSIPLSFLEVGDLVAVDMSNGGREVHLLDQLGFDLGPGGSLDADTRSTKVTARETDDEDTAT